MRIKFIIGLLFSLSILALSQGAFAQVGISVSVGFAPPPIPIYDQPVCPDAGYLWTPGYWAYDEEDGYYWVPGTWVEPPQAGFLWTPGYWGWNDGAYVWNDGYWGPEVGFYGGIDYGFGYFGEGFGGGEWRGGTFFYNTAVVNVNRTTITNVYENRTVIVRNDSHVAFNGGQGGTQARPTPQQEQYSHQHHTPPVAMQAQQRQQARSNPDLRASANRGKPPIAATAKAGDFKTAVMASKKAGGEYHAPPAGAARGNGARPAENKNGANAGNRSENAEAHPNGAGHASDMQPHQHMPRSGGDPAADKKYQQQQEKLDAQQSKDREKLEKHQEKDHQRATAKNYNDAQKQQMEQRHSQQTQQLEQKQATQQKRIEDRQAPKPDKHDH